ncbi:hypothetical protein [Acinetobacter lwoffii]|uniref:hypothetical protein n=1 Tax=Acinetobacter lwoffii TaxID=28090 RepID=UPI00110CE8BC|nr:hypothetical protein [Acinetobacter lwoffii]TMS45876.1 hypothetical protein FGQ54_10560 [Acinetobacter lwoffii]
MMPQKNKISNELIKAEYAISYPVHNTIISYDSQGKTKSIFSDMVWDFSSQIAQINRRKAVHFNFINNSNVEVKDKLIYEAKIISYGLLYAYTGSNSNKLNQLLDDIVQIRFLISLASTINTTLSNISKNNKLFSLILENISQDKRQKIKLLLSFFKKISAFDSIYNNHSFTLTVDQFDQLQKLLNSRPLETQKQYLVIPTRLYSILYNKTELILNEYLENKLSIEKFAKKRAKSIKNEDGKIIYKSRSHKYDHNKEVKDFSVLAKKYKILTKIDLQSYLGKLSEIAIARILMFTGMRMGEILNAPEDCLVELDLYDKKIFIINSYTSKETSNGAMKATWITCSAVQNAIKVLKSINQINSYESSFKKDVNLENPLFLSRANNLNNSLYHLPVKASVRLNDALNYFDYDLLVNGEDLNELKLTATQDEIDFYKVQLDVQFPISTHQFRRSLTVYAARSTIVQTPALKAQLKHLTKDMTYHYCNQSELAPNFIAEPTLVEAYQHEINKYNNDCFLEDVINSTEPLFGASGTRLQNLKNDTNIPVFLLDSKSSLKDIKNGKLFYKRTALGGCSRQGLRDKIAPLSITACLSCSDAVFSERSVRALTKAKENFYKQMKLFDQDSYFALQLRAEINSIDKVLNKRNIYCEIDNA